MQPIRHVGIPLEHVTAEIAAVPVAGELALRLGIVELGPGMGVDPATGELLEPRMPELWRGAERELITQFPGFLVDEMVAMRDRVWFQLPRDRKKYEPAVQRERETVPLHEYLSKLADELIEVGGSRAVPKLLDGDSPDGKLTAAVLAKRRRSWRWLTFALPADLLLAAYDHPIASDRVDLLSPSITNMLRDRGYAETHLHVGAGLDFPTLWVSAQLAMARPEMKSDSFQSPGAVLHEGRELGAWLIRALIARQLLGSYLSSPGPAKNFQEYLETIVCERAAGLDMSSAFVTLVTALADLRNGKLSDAGATFADFQTLYGLLSGAYAAKWPSDITQVDQADRLFNVFPAATHGRPTTEVRFVRVAFAHLRKLYPEPKKECRDPLFASLFWQVVRVRNLLYRHVTQRPMTPGLLWFIRFYGRISAGRKPIGQRTQIELAAQLGGRGHGLKALEVRTAPSALFEENIQYLEEAAKLRRSWRDEAKKTGNAARDCELGVVLHFTKDRGGEARPGVPRAFWRTSNADPFSDGGTSGNLSGFRYATFRNKKMQEAVALAEVLKKYPLSVQILRGLDICTDEMGVPNWVFCPVLKTVRDAAHQATSVLRALACIDVPPLRTTIHAGEDFIHLQTGLRCVAEAIDQLSLREGDRIGHGVALGIDPRLWAREYGRVAMNLEDRLLDLVWEWSWHGSRHGSRVHARQHVLEHEIADLSQRLFGRTIAPFDLAVLRQDLCREQALKLVQYGEIGPLEKISPEKSLRLWLLQQFVADRGLFDRGRQLIWVDVAQEEENLVNMQNELRERVGVLGIAVEVNPTSNLLIGNLEDLTNHPMWRLRSPRPDKDAPPPVGVCVGSDDPITFNSNLRQEYQCLADAMSLAGLSDEESAQWLERARTCGLEHRFTLADITLADSEDKPLRDLMYIELDSSS